MALRKIHGSVPENYRHLSKDEALEYQFEKINDWHNKSDVWPFTYTTYILSGMGTATAMAINMAFRQKLKLRNYAFVSTSLPTAFMAGILSGIFHNHFIRPDVLLRETSCPVCLMCNSAFVQITFSVIYPFIISPLVNVPFASRYATYRVPYIGDFKANIEFYKYISKSCRGKLIPFAIIQSLVAGYLTYAETVSLEKVETKILMTEKFEMMHTNDMKKLKN